jgi:hypothetical protein
MGSITTAFPTSAKVELATATHNYTTTTGNVFKVALIIPSPTGTYGAASTNYSNITGNSDEVTGTGYSAGGFAWTAAQNTTPTSTGTTSFWSWSTNPSWTTATFSAAGCMIYNSSSSNKAVYVGSFGGTQTVTAGTLTLVLPTNDATNAILRIA